MCSKARVWVVDDDEQIVALIKAILDEESLYATRIFTSARVAIEHLTTEEIDCVVTDLVMPEIDGIELQEKFMELAPTVALVFLTGNADVPTTVRVMQRGAVSVLEKPFDPNKLVHVVRDAVARTKRVREQQDEIERIQHRVTQLTEEEREVMDLMISGAGNKFIAHNLHLSSRTVDRRRQRVFQVMRVDSVGQLATMMTQYKRLRLETDKFRRPNPDNGEDDKGGLGVPIPN